MKNKTKHHHKLTNKQAVLQTQENSAVNKGGEHVKWPLDSIDTRRKLKMALQFNLWSQQKPRLHGVPSSERMRDVLNVSYWKLRFARQDASNEELIKDVFCNIQQSVSRLPLTRDHLPCFGTNTIIYSFQHDQVFTGSSHLRFIGWPLQMMPSGIFSDNEQRNLAGESFSVPLCALLQTAIFLNPMAVWWR